MLRTLPMIVAGCFWLVLFRCALADEPAAPARQVPAQQPSTRPATTRAAGPIETIITGLPDSIRLGQPCTARIEFRNIFAVPMRMQTLAKAPNLHLRIWRNGTRQKGKMLPVADAVATIKPGESLFASVDLAALGLTREAGRYLIIADVITYLGAEDADPGKPPLQLPVSATIRFVVE